MISTEPRIKALGDWFAGTGQPLYLVGGYVRNKLLGLPITDIDVCAPVHAQLLQALGNKDFWVTERAYGLGTVVIHQNYGEEEYTYEYTCFRSDSYGRGGVHRPQSVHFTENIALDAARRDFTINALYADTQGNVTDPLGRGLQDIQQRQIAACAPDTMQQDALRILRMVRFSAQLGFAVQQQTLQDAKSCAKNICNISPERIRDELEKILLSDTAYGNKDGVLTGLYLMKQIDAFACVIPELLEGDGFAQKPEYHAYDVMEHSFRACAAASPNLRVRLAALLHDVAKPATYKQDGNMYRHAQTGQLAAETILRRLKFETAVVRDVGQLVACHMFDLTGEAKRKAVTHMIVQLGQEQFLRLCSLREADFEGSGRGAVPTSAQKWREILAELELANAPLRREDLTVDGNDLMRELGIPPGKQLGQLLFALHEIALKKPKQNNYKNLMRYATMMYTGKSGKNDG